MALDQQIMFQKYWWLKKPGWLYVVITVPADALALVGARASAATVMTKFILHLFMEPALQGSSL